MQTELQKPDNFIKLKSTFKTFTFNRNIQTNMDGSIKFQ